MELVSLLYALVGGALFYLVCLLLTLIGMASIVLFGAILLHCVNWVRRSGIARSSLSLFVIASVVLIAQTPIGSGGGLVDTLDWYSATPSGCTPSATTMCVGGGAASRPQGDSYFFTGWAADGSLFGSYNDGFSLNCAGTFGLLKLITFNWATKNASKIGEVNCMLSYQPGDPITSAWFAKCTSGDLTGQCPAGWHVQGQIALDGHLYLTVSRNYNAPSDLTIVRSDDGGATWRNPYSIHHAIAATATGDSPKCGALAVNLPCIDASYPESILFPGGAPTSNTMNMNFFQFGQDGTVLPATGDDCSPDLWVCAIFNENTSGPSSFGHVSRANFPNLQLSDWTFVSALDANYKPTFTGTFSSRSKLVFPINGASDVDALRPRGFIGGPAYIKEFKQYVIAGFRMGVTHATDKLSLYASPKPFGPYSFFAEAVAPNGAEAVAIGINYTVVSTSPPHIQATVMTNNYGHVDAGGGVPFFQKWDFIQGKQPYGNGDVPAYADTGTLRLNSGWRFTSGEEPGTFPRTNLALATDFNGAAGNTIAGAAPFVSGLLGNPLVMTGCYTDAGIICGQSVNSGKGDNTLSPSGVQDMTGYAGRWETNLSTVNYNALSHGNLNAPASMQGNGAYTVIQILRLESLPPGSAPLWQTGNGNVSAAGVQLVQRQTTGFLQLWFGDSPVCVYGYLNNSLAPTIGNWYYVSTVVPIQNATPALARANLWVGVGGTLVDWFAGLPATQLCGGATWPPNVTAAPLIVGAPIEASGTISPNASFQATFVYNGALTKTQNDLIYQAFRKTLAQAPPNGPGITLQ